MNVLLIQFENWSFNQIEFMGLKVFVIHDMKIVEEKNTTRAGEQYEEEEIERTSLEVLMLVSVWDFVCTYNRVR